MELRGLRVWALTDGECYGMDAEVAAIAETAGSRPCHLAGFSAGATVALAAALALGQSVRSVAVLEPAFIGDDDWDPIEAEWRSRWRGVVESPQPERTAAFRGLLMRPGLAPPPPNTPPRWDFHDNLLERMLFRDTGFVSADLAAIHAPVLTIRGGRSSPRWAAVSRRLGEVCPDAREHVFPHLHHFTPPFRDAPEELAAVLLALWASGQPGTVPACKSVAEAAQPPFGV